MVEAFADGLQVGTERLRVWIIVGDRFGPGIPETHGGGIVRGCLKNAQAAIRVSMRLVIER